MKELLVSVASRRAALLEDRRLEDLFVGTQTRTDGNVYRGRVIRVESSLSAAFVDLGTGRNAFLHLSDINPNLSGAGSRASSRHLPPIAAILKAGQDILVQVTKPASGNRGAAVSTYISLPGRYMILVDGFDRDGVTSAISEAKERRRLEGIVHRLPRPSGFGLVVRSSAVGRSAEDLRTDLVALLQLRSAIGRASEELERTTPGLVHDANDFVTRAFSELLDSDTDVVRFDDPQAYRQAEGLVRRVYPGHRCNVELYSGSEAMFSHYGIEDEIRQLDEPDVLLPNGGALAIDKARGMVAVDVLLGTVRPSRGIEAAAFEINLSAAREIPRQLRLRNIEGLIVVDFMDVEEERQRTLMQTLRDEVMRDRASFRILPMSQLGLVEMARSRTASIFLGQTDPVRGTDHVGEAEAVRPKVFLCYRREDSQNQAGRIHDWLTNRFGNEAVFYDLNIPAGEDWRQFIEESIRKVP